MIRNVAQWRRQLWDTGVRAPGADPEGFLRRGDMASARAYSGGLGAEPPAGAPGQGVRGRSPPEAESLLAFVCPRETANLPSFPQIC